MFIKDLTCISPQRTFEGDFFQSEPVIYTGSQLIAIEPAYESIPNSQLRRMGKSNRMATGAAMPLLQKYKTDGIIIGTTDGGMEDCHRFLNQIIQYQEGTLTPTNFVQGSPSSPAGGLALMSANSGYNNTHSNKGLSFENCLMDADLLFIEARAKSLLVGCVEEISQAQHRIETLAGYIKKEDVSSDKLYSSKTPGAVNGEGAAMFVVEAKNDNALAEIVDFDMISYPSREDLLTKADALLKRNGLTTDDVDALMLGFSGDVNTDNWYHGFAKDLFPQTGILSFKNLFGETPSASAFATWFAAQLVSGKPVPEMTFQRWSSRELKTILIYNHYQGNQHGFVLVRKPAPSIPQRGK
ncbi:MAG: beta-ketoacyl synthase chain length factor [Flavobacteriales bacterium]|nr:beta-ketoacyl synthase chain length factor [Flavobacteriales bacterium]